MKGCVIGPFFHNTTATTNMYLDMFENFAVDQMPHRSTFDDDGIPPQYHSKVCTSLNQTFPDWWI
jgi:hypothetical protein